MQVHLGLFDEDQPVLADQQRLHDDRQQLADPVADAARGDQHRRVVAHVLQRHDGELTGRHHDLLTDRVEHPDAVAQPHPVAPLVDQLLELRARGQDRGHLLPGRPHVVGRALTHGDRMCRALAHRPDEEDPLQRPPELLSHTMVQRNARLIPPGPGTLDHAGLPAVGDLRVRPQGRPACGIPGE